MASLSDFIQVGGVKSVQTGFISNVAGLSGAGEDLAYRDITISEVEPSKCVAFSNVGVAPNGHPNLKAAGGAAYDTYDTTLRLTSPTNLRVSALGGGRFQGRWYVVEYA